MGAGNRQLHYSSRQHLKTDLMLVAAVHTAVVHTAAAVHTVVVHTAAAAAAAAVAVVVVHTAAAVVVVHTAAAVRLEYPCSDYSSLQTYYFVGVVVVVAVYCTVVMRVQG